MLHHRVGGGMPSGVNLKLIWRLKPQLHKLAPAGAGFKTIDFSLFRVGGLGLDTLCQELVELSVAPEVSYRSR